LLQCSIVITVLLSEIYVNLKRCSVALRQKAILGYADEVKTLNEVYTSLSMRRRYEVWFLRLALADGQGAWWFRYLLLNPGRQGCSQDELGKPVQVWATWFPADDRPQTFIQSFPLQGLHLSARGQNPFHFAVAGNAIDENSCTGQLKVDGHDVSWELHYSSKFRVTLSAKGWIGFSRTPHSDAVFSGHITLDGRKFEGQPLGFGLQGHNCGYRHRSSWTWTHAYFARPSGTPSTFEALVYDMPLGLMFRRAALWHEGKAYVFRRMRQARVDRRDPQWSFDAVTNDGCKLRVTIDGRGSAIHRLPYLKTDCSGTFEVVNNSLANASVHLETASGEIVDLETTGGAVLEMGGQGYMAGAHDTVVKPGSRRIAIDR